MKLDLIHKTLNKLEPILDVDTFRVGTLSLLGFAGITLGMAAILLPHATTIPLSQTAPITKSLSIGELNGADTQTAPAPFAASEDAVAGMHESSPYGFLPIKTADGKTIFDAYKQNYIPSTQTQPSTDVAATPLTKPIPIIVFDVGLSENTTNAALEKLPRYTTILLSPYAQDAQKIVTTARAKGMEVWLYIPLEPNNTTENDTGPQTLRANAPISENEKILLTSLGMVTGYTGIITNRDNVFANNKDAYAKFNDILVARGIKNIEAADLTISGFNPDEQSAAIFTPLTPKSIDDIISWSKSHDIAPLSYSIMSQ